jgi:glycine/D-amino acid oxidase-like deaminating enzyme
LAESSSARVLDDTDAARHRLLEGVVALGARVFRERAIALEESTRGVVVTTARGRRVNAEIVVLAMAARTSELLPGYEKVLVPMTDAAFFWKRTGTRTGTRAGTGTGTSTGTSTRAPRAATDTTPLAGREGIALRGHSGHVAVVWNPIDSRTPLRISGPRFLWPGAGVGVAHEGNVDSRMRARALDFHRAKTLPLLARALGCPTWEAFAEREGLVFEGGRFGVDCLPCDELPVVGEFGRWGRILGASGFLGTGWSAHVSSARALADFVDRGASKDLHPRLSPRRFDAGT